MTRRLMYITWDGPQVSYLEGLFLPIFLGLKEHDIKVHVLQFTWDETIDAPGAVSSAARACARAGIPYKRAEVNRSFGGFGPYWTARRGARLVDDLAERWSIDALMPRSIMPSVAVKHSRASKRLPIIFDADGLAADERVDFAGLSRWSATYRLQKYYEHSMIRSAQSVIGRTAAACKIYSDYDPASPPGKFVVSVNGRDANFFRRASSLQILATRKRLGLPAHAPVIVHNGSFGDKYCPDTELALFRAIKLRCPGAIFLVLSGQAKAAKEYISHYGPDLLDHTAIFALPFAEMSSALAACDLGLCFYRDTFSNRAFQATKLGEFLLCGVPVVATPNALLPAMAGNDFAYSLDLTQSSEVDAVAAWFIENVVPFRTALGDVCREFGLAHLTIERSVEAYQKAIEDASYRVVG